jgi:hypothetical protein
VTVLPIQAGRSRMTIAQSPVMPGLVPGIHVFEPRMEEDVDGRDKPGHDIVDRKGMGRTCDAAPRH